MSIGRWMDKKAGVHIHNGVFSSVQSLSHVRLFVTPQTLCSPPGFTVHVIFHGRILEWVAISFSRGFFWPRAAIKKSTNNKRCRGCGEKGTLLHCWWECRLVHPLWRTVWRSLRKLQIELPYNPAIYCWTYTLRKSELKETHVPQCSSQHCL